MKNSFPEFLKRQRFSFWLLTILNFFFLFVMAVLAKAPIGTCVTLFVLFQGLVLAYYWYIDRNPKKGFLREWGDAILFAIVAATLIRTFFIEAFTIPTS